MPLIEKNLWKTRDGRFIPMDQLEEDHLKRNFLTVTKREYDIFVQANELFRKLNTLQLLKSKLRQAADKRNIELVYPDQIENTVKYGIYFEAERKVNNMKAEKLLV